MKHKPLQNTNGQAIRRRGQEKRQLLVDATRRLLKERSLTRLTTADIARAAGTSPPNFYLYFAGVNEAVLAAVADVSMATPEVLAALQADWPVAEVQQRAEGFVALYLQHWHANAPVLRARTLLVTEGDPRFIAAERAASAQVLEALTAKIGRHAAGNAVHPASAAAAVLAMLERLAAYGPPAAASPLGVTPPRLISACAAMLRLVLTAGA